MVIDLGKQTAQQLIAAASSEGMTVEEFVRALLNTSLYSSSQISTTHPADQDEQLPTLVGSMSDQADFLDEVLKDTFESRERDPLRLDSDG